MSQCYLNILFHLLPPANEVCGKVMFLQVSVILSTWGACVAGEACVLRTPPTMHTPTMHAPLCHTCPPLPHMPPHCHVCPHHACPPHAPLPFMPPAMHLTHTRPSTHAPPATHAPGHACPPPCLPPYDMRSMSGRYASYWHVFLFSSVFVFFRMRIMQRLS